MSKFNVICSECSEEHSTDEVQLLNVEENMQGQDIMYFECPVTGLEAKSLVYATTYDEYDGQPDEYTEWMDYDPDC